GQREVIDVPQFLEDGDDPVELLAERFGPRPYAPIQAGQVSLDLRRALGPVLVLLAIGAGGAGMLLGGALELAGARLSFGVGSDVSRRTSVGELQRGQPGGQISSVAGAPAAPAPRQVQVGEPGRRGLEVPCGGTE